MDKFLLRIIDFCLERVRKETPIRNKFFCYVVSLCFSIKFFMSRNGFGGEDE